ncbi:hypothetical protein [Pseudomonas mosselii]|uniref:hypothetical protein n=1 Tax=Pseudomonas mosselii TaxID=78327 RepID=UPI001F4C1B64|nr:hypothetical protein [Pseudomonas mosselii]MCH7419606.1 hypothetical protein [Pseudomonas mosselii]
MSEYKTTVGELRRQLASYPDDDEVIFEGGLTLGRVKRRGPDLVSIEFAEVQAYLDAEYKAENPDVMVVFLKPEN